MTAAVADDGNGMAGMICRRMATLATSAAEANSPARVRQSTQVGTAPLGALSSRSGWARETKGAG